MKTFLLFALSYLLVQSLSSQNVGIGTSTPSEKLDVNGSINVTGTIKANGITGQTNQVLTVNGAGNLEWSNAGALPNFASFNTSGNWTVPDGITKVVVEVWGAGGGGSQYGSGAGGGYIKGNFTVTPGSSITFSIGTGGSGAASAANAGQTSAATVGSIVLTANGGSGSFYNSSGGFVGTINGGNYSATSGFNNYIGCKGEAGLPNIPTYVQSGTSSFLETTYGARGGSAGNTINTGGTGAFRISNQGSTVRYGLGTAGIIPGGGGGGYFVEATTIGGTNGGGGLVIVRY
jgi:hypothetical protein